MHDRALGKEVSSAGHARADGFGLVETHLADLLANFRLHVNHLLPLMNVV